ncbi:acyl-CoA dehydrogenase [Streptomyces sp. LP05-1]|uniref:Acyl-CoA dehydrogenase n=1 Tax=Streptomyces pyxinae TaxID=2970734 RepID=A0ABT2CBR0_9ACTN|nr:acyl-CoA dehydrogenase [Streptomyces sp. LP05-1]MCS0634852.1 acyl-CoA dehydrogenase [Streptomyces sp. LP05-1]
MSRAVPGRRTAGTAPVPALPSGDGPEWWPRVAREVADDLAVDAAARDRAGKPPFDEAARLREAGLPALLAPPEATAAPGGAPRSPAGGRETDWPAACAVVRELATADSSIGEILAHHYALFRSARFFGAAETAERFEREAAREGWLLAGGVFPPEGRTDDAIAARRVAGGHVLTGSRAFATGVAVADRLVVGVRPSPGPADLLAVLVDPAAPGVLVQPAGDRPGQRLSGAGTVAFEDVLVPADAVLGTVPPEEYPGTALAALAPLALRLILAQVTLGTAEGALAEARDSSRAAWAGGAGPGGSGGFAGRDSTDATDPYLLLAYGELSAAALSAAAVLERATLALGRGMAAAGALGADERADIAVLVAVAEAVTGEVAVRLTSRLLELTDAAEAPDEGPGLDRFWRNARMLTARNSPAHRLRDIGDHYLSGTRLRLTSYA